MFYPEKFKPFVKMTTIFVDAVSYLDNIIPEYDSLLSEESEKLKPYVIDSHPLLIEYYSTPIEKLYKEFRKESEITKRDEFTKEEFKQNISTLLSDEYYDSFIPDNDEDARKLAGECLPELFACARFGLMNVRSNMKNKTTINQLVASASEGDDESLLSAVRIDPIVEKVPAISERIDLAYSLNETKFLNRLQKIREAKREDKRVKNQTLDYFLLLYHVTGILNQLKFEQIAHIFINELGIYDKEDESLKSHIRRWCKNYNKHILRVNNLIAKKSSA